MPKVKDQDYFVYSQGVLSFTYYPFSGMVKAVNPLSFHRSIEHFAYRGMEIDWSRSNINTLTLFVKVPDYMSEEDSMKILETSTEYMFNQRLENETKAREERIQGNYDHVTKEILTENTLKRRLEQVKGNKNWDRHKVCDWFNHYNIEDIRPDAPLLRVSTRARTTVFNDGRKLLWKLFEQGKLERGTEEYFKDKIKKYTGK